MICTLTIEQKEKGVSMEINYGDTTNLESPNYAQRSMAIISTFADNLLKDINTVISEMEEAEMEKEASILHKLFLKLSKSLKASKNGN